MMLLAPAPRSGALMSDNAASTPRNIMSDTAGYFRNTAMGRWRTSRHTFMSMRRVSPVTNHRMRMTSDTMRQVLKLSNVSVMGSAMKSGMDITNTMTAFSSDDHNE